MASQYTGRVSVCLSDCLTFGLLVCLYVCLSISGSDCEYEGGGGLFLGCMAQYNRYLFAFHCKICCPPYLWSKIFLGSTLALLNY